MENNQSITDAAMALMMAYGGKLLLAAVVLLAGWWLVGRVLYFLDRTLSRSHAEKTLRTFLHSFTNILLKGVLLVIVASMVGVETASLIALLGAAGLAVGLALQGSLANFAGGGADPVFQALQSGRRNRDPGLPGRSGGNPDLQHHSENQG